ncbi:hypothetical protein AKJ16_DCAP05705 [Drosera capensis]
MLRDLAKNKKWQRCRSCKFYVERKDGCNYMMCRVRHKITSIFQHKHHCCTAGIFPPSVWPSQELPNVMLPQVLPPQGLPQNQVRTSGSVRNVLSPPYMVGMIPPFGRLLQGLPQGQPPQGLPQVLPPQESSLNQVSTRGSVRGVLSRPNFMIPSFGRPLQGSQQGQPSQGPPQL